MKLKALLKNIVCIDEDREIAGLALDSRLVAPGNVFMALSGSTQHGLAHAEQALEKGAVAVIYDPTDTGDLLSINEKFKETPFIAVENLGIHLGDMAACFYDYPSRHLNVIGITGTNGKTSCSQFLAQVLDDCGFIGTLGWGEWGNTNKTVNTTPDALAIQQILSTLLKDKKQTVAMEVSSHGLEQGRVNGVYFTGAVYTNISRDHLDYHGTMDAYLQAKLELLNKPGLKFVVVNLDDDYSEKILAAIPESLAIWGVSIQGRTIKHGESVLADNIVHGFGGIEFDVRWRGNSERVKVPLYGDFNSENVLTILTVMLAMGKAMAEAVERLKFIQPVTGRMERFGEASDPLIFIDYAHTPDALQKVLSGLKKHCQQALWLVFGCGGNRDNGKRPLMGACADLWADHIIVTDDNPRYEKSMDIINDILKGCHTKKVEVIQNREEAIKKAITKAAANDCIVIAGKGHEDYQEIKGVRQPFSDSLVVNEALKMRVGIR